MELVFAPVEIGRPLYAPPGVAPERVAALRAALEATLSDNLLLADAEKSGLPVHHISGASSASLVAQVYATPRDVLDTAARIRR